jgi:hypothetical protein
MELNDAFVDERIDALINSIDLETDTLLVANPNLDKEIETFIQDKREAFVNALYKSRDRLNALSINKNECRNYFFLTKLENYKPNVDNYKYFLGFLHIVTDKCVSKEIIKNSELFTKFLLTDPLCFEQTETDNFNAIVYKVLQTSRFCLDSKL